MSKHFQLLDFIRKAPKELLQAYCTRRDILLGFDWGRGKQLSAERFADALKQTDRDMSDRVVSDFHQIWDLHGRGFSQGLLNEARYHDDDAAYERLQKLSALGKAFWATLERPIWVANAKIFSDVDKLPDGAWIRRGNLPARAGPVDQSTVERLQDELIEYFMRKEHRGRNCKIDCLRRGDEDVFYTYAEDHPDTDLFWHEGELQPQKLSPSFRLIFKHNDPRRTLDVHVEGDRSVVPELQQIFARTVIGDEIPAEARADQDIYDLDRLLEAGFEFEHSPDLGIAAVRVTKMRFRLDGEPWRRFTAEADTTRYRDALDAFVDDLTSRLPKLRLALDQVCMNVTFHKRPGDRKAPSRTFYITHPNSIRLKKDELGEKIEAMLAQSGIERAVVDEVP